MKRIPDNGSTSGDETTGPRLVVRSFNSAVLKPLSLTLMLCVQSVCFGAAERVEGTIRWSDDTTQTGRLSLTPGRRLTLIDREASRQFAFELSQVAAIEFIEEKTETEQAWRFPVAGQTRKEKSGKPYPIRVLGARVHLRSGEVRRGHLYTTVLYLEADREVRKFVLKSKQKGEPGDSFEDLVYPKRISFAHAGKAEPTTGWTVAAPGASEAVALSRPSLDRYEGSGRDGSFVFTEPLAPGQAFVAARRDDVLAVAWPHPVDEAAVARIHAALGDVKDFLDEREVKAAVVEDDMIYSLVMLRRRGSTTYGAKRNQPWRLEIFRWKTSSGEDGKLMLGGRGYFFRGILAEHEEPPRVRVQASLDATGVDTRRRSLPLKISPDMK